MVQCDFSFLADYASEKGGYVTAHGIGVDFLTAPSLPATHPHIYLVAQFRCPAEEIGAKNLVLRLTDSSGQTILEQAGTIQFAPAGVSDSSVARLVLGFHMITFHATGRNDFHVEVDGHALARLPFTIFEDAPQG